MWAHLVPPSPQSVIASYARLADVEEAVRDLDDGKFPVRQITLIWRDPDGADFIVAGSLSSALFDSIEEASPEYNGLRQLNSRYVSAQGFAYLNSASSRTLWSAIQQAMRTTIERLGDRRLHELYARWTHANDLREAAFMKGVEDYARQTPFSIGVLLVGLAHGQSIIDLSRSKPGAASSTIQWDLAGFLERPNLTVARHNEEL